MTFVFWYKTCIIWRQHIYLSTAQSAHDVSTDK